MIYTATAAGLGVLNRVECEPGSGDAGRTRFDGGAWLDWPAAGRDVRLAASGVWLLAVAKGQQGDAAGGKLIVGNQHGASKVISDVSGEFAVAVEPVGDGLFRVACVLPGARQWRTWLVSGDLSTIAVESTQDVPDSIPGTSQGWTEFKDGVPTWKDLAPNVVLGGALFSEPSRAGRWTVGLSNRAFGVDAYDHELQRVMRVWDGDTSVRPSIASLPDGRALVAVCSDDGAFVSSSDFNAAWTVPPIPPVALPPFPKTDRKVFVRVMDEPNTQPPIWGTVEVDDPALIVASVARAEAAEQYFFGYNDRGQPKPEKTPKGHFALVRAYPMPGESHGAFVARLLEDVGLMRDAGYRVALMACGFRGVKGDGTYHRTLDQVRLGLRASWQLCCDGLAEGLEIFNWDKSWHLPNVIGRHVRDGVTGFPELMSDVQAMRAASGDWRFFPVRPAEDDDMTPTLDAKTLKPYWEWPTTHVVCEGTNGRFLSVSDDGLIAWVKGKNEAGQAVILSGQAFEYQSGQGQAVAHRNGVRYPFKVF